MEEAFGLYTCLASSSHGFGLSELSAFISPVLLVVMVAKRYENRLNRVHTPFQLAVFISIPSSASQIGRVRDSLPGEYYGIRKERHRAVFVIFQ